jgi:branched-chain amino acid transport system substrate-binding protein
MRKGHLLVGLAALTVAGLTGVWLVPAGAAPLERTAAAASSCNAKIGFMGPFTGAAAPIGQEQLHWGQFGLANWNKAHHTNIQFELGDTQLVAAQAVTVGRKFQSDSSVVGILGPAGSQEVAADGPIFTRAGLAYVSMSATDPKLSKYSTFFRDVPTDAQQGPNDADYLAKTLHVKSVYVIDDQSSYSTGLAASTEAQLKKDGVAVKTDSVTQQVGQDWGPLASKIDTGAVFLPWQIAANAQEFAQALQAAGKGSVKVFGSDGLYSPGTFTAAKSYVSSFAPDIRGIPADKATVTAYNKKYGKKWGTFGPPTYVAAQVLASAVTKACAGGAKPSRSAVLKNVAATHMKTSLLGPISFSNHNLKGARFFIFQIQANGSYKLVH